MKDDATSGFPIVGSERDERRWHRCSARMLRRLRDEEDGFTLIELMVVVMILAILIVMGLPTFSA